MTIRFVPVKPFSEGPCASYEAAAIALVGAPLDVTGSYRGGTRLAPCAIREISWELEDYSFDEGRSILAVPFFDRGDLLFAGDLRHNLRQIEALVRRHLADGKKTLLLGGEHLITWAAVRAMRERHEDLHLVVFDAHADLSDPYRRMRLSHACTVRLCHEELGADRIFLLGVRTGTREDRRFIKERLCLHPREVPAALVRRLRDKPVYVSVDLDVLDPASAPGVTTPQLRGWTFEMLDRALDRLRGLRRIVGADVVELCPPYDPAGVTALMGAEVARKLLFLMDRAKG